MKMIEETFNFIKNLLPYILVYSFIFISIILAITFFLSSWLSKKDEKKYEERKTKIEEELVTTKDIKELVKEEELLEWIKNKHEKKIERLKELSHLKEISPARTKEYLKKGLITLPFVFISLFSYYQLYQSDIKSHQPSVYFENYSEVSNKELDLITIKEENFDSFKQVTVFDKEQSVEYFYIIKEEKGNIKNIYYTQSIVIPQLLQNIFMIFYLLFIAFFRYISRLLF